MEDGKRIPWTWTKLFHLASTNKKLALDVRRVCKSYFYIFVGGSTCMSSANVFMIFFVFPNLV